MDFHWTKRDPLAVADYTPLETAQTDSFVYFLGSEDGTRIKTGFSGKPDWSRIRTHQSGDAFRQGGDVRILAVVRGTRVCERFIQRYFHAQRVSGEREIFSPAGARPRFHLGDPLCGYVVWLRDNYYVSTTKEEFVSDSGRTAIEPNAWLPDPSRLSNRENEKGILSIADPWGFIPDRRITADDWYTPESIVAVAKLALGGNIDLDPASNPIANGKWIRAKRFFTIGENALTKSWISDRVFLNPPFSDYDRFGQKVVEEIANGHMTQIVLLGPMRILSAKYCERLLRSADAIGFVTGRTPMWGIKTDSTPVDGWFLIYVGAHVDRFLAAMDGIGVGYRRS